MATVPSWTEIALASARRYGEVMVPTVMAPFAEQLVSWAAPTGGDVVVDVGCGTGAATRLAAAAVGPFGRVIGLDSAPAMLEVARSSPPKAAIEWLEAPAERLPVADGSASIVVCSQVLQFVADRAAALREMRRVLRPAGRAAIASWASLGMNPYFDAFNEARLPYARPEDLEGIKATFSFGDHPEELRSLLVAAGFHEVELRVVELTLPLPQLREFVPHHMECTAMASTFAAMPAAKRQQIVDDVIRRLGPAAGGPLRFTSNFVRGTA